METTSEWYTRALSACEPFTFSESRYRTPWMDDELGGSLQHARRWLGANPCPDDSIGDHLLAMLDAYAEMKGATVGRVMELRDVIEQHSKFVDRRKYPRDEVSPSHRRSGAG
jgi:hypothetical protein